MKISYSLRYLLENPATFRRERAVGGKSHGGGEDQGEGTGATAGGHAAAVAGDTVGGVACNLVEKTLTASGTHGQSCLTWQKRRRRI